MGIYEGHRRPGFFGSKALSKSGASSPALHGCGPDAHVACCRDAGEVIHEAAMGMRFGATARDFIDMIHVYPTMAEALMIVALSFFKDVSKMSCCAE
jgi:hypothetical protein